MKKHFLTALSIAFSTLNLFGQCDTSFYNFKCEIIKKISIKIDSLDTRNCDNCLNFQFANYQCYAYKVGDYKSPVGFYLLRSDSAFSVPNLIPHNEKYTCINKDALETFLSVDIFDSISLITNHTYAKVIDNPIQGWRQIEEYFFLKRQGWNESRETEYAWSVIIPVYIFKDRKIAKAFAVSVIISGTTKDDIIISSIKQFV